jgi:osmoprotectant transport system ATP-binding protein
MGPSAMIVLEGVTKKFSPSGRPAVDGVSLHVSAGEMLVLLGGSGSGKTTTLKMINRLVEPDGGRLLVNGQDIAAADPVALRRTIGYVFQGVGLFPHLSVADNIAVVPRLLGWDEGKVRARVVEMLRMVKLAPENEGEANDFLKRRPDSLSGGQQQRVGFARALAAGQSVLLLDEPFGALDPQTRDEVRRDFKALCKSGGLTAVLVTHDMTEALLLADRIAVMKDGRVAGRVATPRELLADPGDDYVRQLLTAPERQMRELEALWGKGAT